MILKSFSKFSTCYAGLLVAPLAAFAQNYNLIDLGTLGGVNSYGLGINESGTIVGYSDIAAVPSVYHGVIWSGSSKVDLGTILGGAPTTGNSSAALSINDSGQVVGQSAANSIFAGSTVRTLHAFVYTPGVPTGVTKDLTSVDTVLAQANAINASGTIVGVSTDPSFKLKAALFNGDGTFQVLGSASAVQSAANGINASGVIVGHSYLDANTAHAAVFKPGVSSFTDLGTLGGANSSATAVNDSGVIVGASDVSPGIKHAAVFSTTGSPVDLGGLGGTNSIAYGINLKGDIVGSFSTPDGSEIHGFVKLSSGGMTDLNSLVTNPGGVITEAKGINGNGDIVGTVVLPDGTRHAVELVPAPVPEPSTYALALGGIAALAWVARRK
jgi:probable HAF family extracellular repeat protein